MGNLCRAPKHAMGRRHVHATGGQRQAPRSEVVLQALHRSRPCTGRSEDTGDLVEREDGVRGKEFDCFHFTSRASIGNSVPYSDAERQVNVETFLDRGLRGEMALPLQKTNRCNCNGSGPSIFVVPDHVVIGIFGNDTMTLVPINVGKFVVYAEFGENRNLGKLPRIARRAITTG